MDQSWLVVFEGFHVFGPHTQRPVTDGFRDAPFFESLFTAAASQLRLVLASIGCSYNPVYTGNRP